VDFVKIMLKNETRLVSEEDDSLFSDSIYSSSDDDRSSTELENHLMESVIKTDHVRFRNKKYEKWMSSVLNAKIAMISSEWSNLLTGNYSHNFNFVIIGTSYVRILFLLQQFKHLRKHSNQLSLTHWSYSLQYLVYTIVFFFYTIFIIIIIIINLYIL
jgi:hypothetical protein